MVEVLVDTNVWVHHFKHGDQRLIALLEAGSVVTHEFVVEELMLGGLGSREKHLHLLLLLQRFGKASHEEIAEFIRLARSKRFKVGLIDSYLLSCAMLHDLRVYSHDAGLARAAVALGIAL